MRHKTIIKVLDEVAWAMHYDMSRFTEKGKWMLWKEHGGNHPYVKEEWKHAKSAL